MQKTCIVYILLFVCSCTTRYKTIEVNTTSEQYLPKFKENIKKFKFVIDKNDISYNEKDLHLNKDDKQKIIENINDCFSIAGYGDDNSKNIIKVKVNLNEVLKSESKISYIDAIKKYGAYNFKKYEEDGFGPNIRTVYNDCYEALKSVDDGFASDSIPLFNPNRYIFGDEKTCLFYPMVGEKIYNCKNTLRRLHTHAVHHWRRRHSVEHDVEINRYTGKLCFSDREFMYFKVQQNEKQLVYRPIYENFSEIARFAYDENGETIDTIGKSTEIKLQQRYLLNSLNVKKDKIVDVLHFNVQMSGFFEDKTKVFDTNFDFEIQNIKKKIKRQRKKEIFDRLSKYICLFIGDNIKNLGVEIGEINSPKADVEQLYKNQSNEHSSNIIKKIIDINGKEKVKYNF